ncbi:Uncharacterised protein [Candidatus Burarchaeum australiense]|nr:Uncharacterised protein [Candidatus Burarchaeum australiense]
MSGNSLLKLPDRGTTADIHKANIRAAIKNQKRHNDEHPLARYHALQERLKSLPRQPERAHASRIEYSPSAHSTESARQAHLDLAAEAAFEHAVAYPKPENIERAYEAARAAAGPDFADSVKHELKDLGAYVAYEVALAVPSFANISEALVLAQDARGKFAALDTAENLGGPVLALKLAIELAFASRYSGARIAAFERALTAYNPPVNSAYFVDTDSPGAMGFFKSLTPLQKFEVIAAMALLERDDHPTFDSSSLLRSDGTILYKLPDNQLPLAYLTLAKLYCAVGNYNAAMKAQKRSLDVSMDHKPGTSGGSTFSLDDVYFSGGRMRLTSEDFAEALKPVYEEADRGLKEAEKVKAK